MNQRTPSANGAGWNNTEVTLSWSANDTLSGVDTNTLTGATVYTNETSSTVVNGTVTDLAGNTANGNITVKLDMTAPTITNTVSPAANANGWHTNDVTVTFYGDDGLSGLASVTSQVVLTNEVIDEMIVGTATDNASNIVTDVVFVSIDKGEPTLTGNPGHGDIITSLRPPFVVQYSDEGSGLDELSLEVILDDTNNVTANFVSTINGALWVPTNDLSSGSHRWQITVADLAGHEVTAEATFTLTTNAALISGLNLATGVTMPDVEAVWVQGVRADTNTAVTYSVNYGAPKNFNARWDQFGMLVPLDFGTNIVEITGSMGGTNTSMALTVIRSDRYRAKLNAPSSGDFVMDGPAMGYFANGEPQDVTGLVSLTLDEGTEDEATISSVSVNGVSAALGSPDGNGDVLFDTVDPVFVTTNFSSATVTVCYTNSAGTQCHTIPLGVWEGYFVLSRETHGIGGNSGLSVVCIQDPSFDCCESRPVVTRETSSFRTEWGATTNTAAYIYGDWTSCTYGTAPAFEDFDFGDDYWWDLGPTAVEGWQPPDRGMSFGVEVHSSRWIKDYEGDGIFEEDEKIDFGGTLDYTRGPNTMTFTTPVFYSRDEDTAVIFTFEGLSYHTAPGETMNLSNVVFKYEGQSLEPVEVTENSAGYMLAVRGNQHITVTEDSFDWPPVSSNPVVTTNAVGSEVWVFTDDTYGKRLTFTGFHNQQQKMCGKFIVRDIADIALGHEEQRITGQTTLDGFEVEFVPDDDCNCNNPRVAQAVQSAGLLSGQPPHIDTGPEQRRQNRTTTGGIPIPAYTDSGRAGNHGALSYLDAPFNSRNLTGRTSYTFEACALCSESGGDRVLGCVSFSFETETRKTSVSSATARENHDGVEIKSKRPGALWKNAVSHWNNMRPQ